MRNVETEREKARVATLIAGEDRIKVRQDLAGLNQLHVDHPEIHKMPGHDAAAVALLVRSGLLMKGF